MLTEKLRKNPILDGKNHGFPVRNFPATIDPRGKLWAAALLLLGPVWASSGLPRADLGVPGGNPHSWMVSFMENFHFTLDDDNI